MSDSLTEVRPVICRCCFEEIPPSPENPNLICPKCGTRNNGAPPPIEVEPAKPPRKSRRELAAAEKTVLLLIGVMVLLVLCAMLGAQPPGSHRLDFASGLFMLAIWSAGIIFYFAPSLAGKRKWNAKAILLLNLFLGWTVVGWVVALVWASTKQAADEAIAEDRIPCPECAELILPQARVCKHCGAKLKPQD